MWTRHHKQRAWGRLIVPSLAALFLTYFGFHAYHGSYGIYSKYQLQAQARELTAQLDEVRGRRLELEQRVRLLQDGSLEKDMLDEQARKALNVSLADELVIMRD
jgi:cell division protein FtsB